MRAHANRARGPCSETQRRLCERPAEPRGGQAEGGRRRHDRHLLRIDMARQHRADAVHEGIAGGEHADLPAAQRERLLQPHLSNGDGHGRAAPRISARGQRQVALAAEHDLGAANQPRATALRPSMPSSPMPTMDSQRGDAAFSGDSDQQAPCNASSSSAARTEARQLAERLASRAGLARDLVAGRPHRRSRPRNPCRCAVGGFGGAAGLAAISRAQRHRCADRCDPSLCRATMSANAARCAQPRARVHGSRSRRPPWKPRPATAGPRSPICAEAVRALGTAPRRVFLALGRKELRAVRGGAAASLSHPQCRSGRRRRWRCRTREYLTGARAVRRGRRARAAGAASHRHHRRQEQRRRRHLRQDRSGARARPAGDHAAAAAAARRCQRSQPSRKRWRWLDHALASAAARGV